MTVFEALQSGRSGRRAGLMLRHAPREPIRSAADVLDAPITAAGAVVARALGASLAEAGQILLWHSPIHRTKQTAAALLEGIVAAGGAGRVAGMLPALGGPYLTDPEGAMRAFVKDRLAFMRDWFDGRLPRSLVLPLTESADLQLHGIEAAWRPEEQADLAVFVTHDLNLLVLREALFGVRHEDAGWIDCLDGLWLELFGGGLRVGAGQRTTDVTV